MTEKDAIAEVDEATADLKAHDETRSEKLERLKRAVYQADKLDYPRAALARRIGRDAVTVRRWCREIAKEEQG